jgi:hypothetical protein
MLRERPRLSFGLAGAAFLIHPLTVEAALPLLLAMALLRRPRPWRALAQGLGVFLIVASPLLARALTHHAPGLHLFQADRLWVQALAARSSAHMFPLTWGWTALAQVGVALALIAIAWPDRGAAGETRHRAMLVFVAGAVVLCGVQILIADVRPVGLAFLLQLPRVFQFVMFTVALYVANAVRARIERGRARDIALAAGLAAAAAWGAYAFVVAATIGVCAVLALAAQRRWRGSLDPAPAAATVALVVAIGGALFVANDLADGRGTGFSYHEYSPPAWRAAQEWARQHTPIDALFIVPPEEETEFRVISERSVYADWEDGGLMNGNPSFTAEWVKRMRRLGYRDLNQESRYDSLGVADFEAIAGEAAAGHSELWVVRHRDSAPLALPLAYRNAYYLIYRLTPLATAGPGTASSGS